MIVVVEGDLEYDVEQLHSMVVEEVFIGDLFVQIQQELKQSWQLSLVLPLVLVQVQQLLPHEVLQLGLQLILG